jgi:hypothetical protein
MIVNRSIKLHLFNSNPASITIAKMIAVVVLNLKVALSSAMNDF